MYLREVAKTMLLSARGNEIIFEFTDVMQLDIFMETFEGRPFSFPEDYQ